jgi:hypothetical protein
MAQRSRLGAGTSISQHYDFGLDLNSSAWDGNSQQRRVRVEMREPECRNPSGTCARTKRSRLDAIWRDGAIEPLQTLERERGGISHLRLPPRCPAASSSFRQSTTAVLPGRRKVSYRSQMGFLDSVSSGLKYAALETPAPSAAPRGLVLLVAALQLPPCKRRPSPLRITVWFARGSSAAAATQKAATKAKLKTEISLLEGRA